jgi:protein FAM50
LTPYRAKEKAQKKKSKKEVKSKLSFAMDDEEEEEDSRPTKKVKKASEFVKKINLKNPAVDTSFLPDREREELDRLAREELRQEWLRKQEVMKAEMIEVVYSYWDGSGHRKSVTVREKESGDMN